MHDFVIYTKPNCSQCVEAKNLMDLKNMTYEERIIDVGQEKDPGAIYVSVADLKSLVPTARTVPQIFSTDTFTGRYVGGYAELKEFLHA